ncbi:MAG: hypothetical protein ACYS6I_06360 [Planctomycetota bacterium]|jgi:hypothetical protein
MESRNRVVICKWILKTFIIFFLGIVAGFVICAKLYQHEALEKQKVESFIDQIIDSVINKTDFYRDNSSERASTELRKYADDLGTFYKAKIYDKTFHAYESLVTFYNRKEFYVDVIVFGDDITLNEWKLVKR